MKLSLVALLLLCSLHTIHAGSDPVDRFTSTAPEKSKLLEEGEDSFRYRCPGVAGYAVIHEGAHGRGWINLEYDGEQTDLMNDILNACRGEFPTKANDVVQWRGVMQDGVFVPYACIFRMASQQEGRRVEDLVVLQLAGAGSRVVGSVPAGKGNAAAEALADEQARME